EHVRGKFDRAGLLSVGAEDVENESRVSHLTQAPFTALRTYTTRLRAPGTAPLTSSTPFSVSTACTVRLRTVTRSPPIRPAMRVPLKTRLGVAEAPIEPGLRWLRCAPCEAPTPEKLWRFMVPAKPLPLLVPTTSTSWPASKVSPRSEE